MVPSRSLWSRHHKEDLGSEIIGLPQRRKERPKKISLHYDLKSVHPELEILVQNEARRRFKPQA